MSRVFLNLLISIITFFLGIGTSLVINSRDDASEPFLNYAIPVQPLPQAASTNPPRILQPVASSLEIEWHQLTSSEICLLGTQYYVASRDVGTSDETFVNETFNPFGWLPSSRKDLNLAIEFLIRQIPDTSPARVHACPLARTSKGELAIYCLQLMLKQNWFELKDEYQSRFDQLPYSNKTDQDLLTEIIGTKKGATEMMNLWRWSVFAKERTQPGTCRLIPTGNI